jgi:hypothetical protein
MGKKGKKGKKSPQNGHIFPQFSQFIPNSRENLRQAEVLSAAIQSEYGHWSHTLRKAFDYEFLSYNRRKDKRYRECDRLKLNKVIKYQERGEYCFVWGKKAKKKDENSPNDTPSES